VQAVLAYAKLIANPHDELSLQKVLSFPKRGFPKDLLDQVPRTEAPILECLRDHCASLGHPWTAPVLDFLAQVDLAIQSARTGGLHGPLTALLIAAGIFDAFEPGSRKRERVDEFLSLFKAEEERNPEADLKAMLGSLALDTQIDDDPEEKPGVRLMTVHAAKGLEFHTVFLPTLDDDVFPSKPNHTDAGIEEERRLFYVALTRAKKRLFLSWPATKVHYRVVRDVVPSRFLREIPDAHWDGPLGKKDKEDKKEFLDNFFASLKDVFVEEDT
jgi:DNA helicase-2/ATP-dependent DNA helicase PcrA